MKISTTNKNLTALPPDLYSRNYFIALGIRAYKNNNKLKSVKILDVGGRNGLLLDFLDKGDKISVLDLLPGGGDNYFVGDASDMKIFKDASFDIVVSGDVFEHIEENKRKSFISECARVSKDLVIIAAPFSTSTVEQAEETANDFYKSLNGEDHPWLIEHIENKLPDLDKTINYIEENGYNYSYIGSEEISGWINDQIMIYLSSYYSASLDSLIKYYEYKNNNVDLDAPDYYRHVIYFSKKEQLALKKVRKISTLNIALETSLRHSYYADLLKIFWSNMKNNEKKAANCDQQLGMLRSENLEIKSSKYYGYYSWARDKKEKFINIFSDEGNHYEGWLRGKEKRSSNSDCSQKADIKFSVLMPVYNVDPKWLNKCIKSVTKQDYRNWELCIYDDCSTNAKTIECLRDWENRNNPQIKIKYGKTNVHISEASNKAIGMGSGDYFVLLDNDDELSKNALLECALAISENPGSDLLYSDEDKIDEKGKLSNPFFKPDWSPELLLSVNYITHLACIKKEIGDSVGWFRSGYEGSQDYDLFLRITEKTDKIIHIPKVLYHWRTIPTSTAGNINSKGYCTDAGVKSLEDYSRRNKLDSVVAMGENPTEYHFKHKLTYQPLISIIIPFKDDVAVLKKCLESILEITSYPNYEIILLSNNSEEQRTKKYVQEIKKNPRVRYFEYNRPFNYSAICNYGANKSTGELLLFLNNDTEVISPDWLQDMAGYALRSDIGLVGGKLLFPDGTIQHSGVIVGIGGFADHIFSRQEENVFHFFGKDTWSRNFLAVTGACLMVEREKFYKIGKFDEDFIICGSDVELGLRAHDQGFRNVYLSFVKLYHHEAKTRKGAVDPMDITMSQKCYAPVLKDGDPYYNINLSLENTKGDELRREND